MSCVGEFDVFLSHFGMYLNVLSRGTTPIAHRDTQNRKNIADLRLFKGVEGAIKRQRD